MAVLRGGTVIAEMKRRSPSGGALRTHLDCGHLARRYSSAGAAAISVLTDGPDFGGSLEDLAAARRATDRPLLRKDFIVDPIQVAEARVAGADWVLLITALLTGERLEGCLAAAARSGAQAIVEVHDEDEVERAVGAGATCVGINNRDLRTLSTDIGTFARLRPRVPSGLMCIAESGVRGPADVRALISEGADAVLVGELLMRAPDPAAACAEIVVEARRASDQHAERGFSEAGLAPEPGQ
ncbi:MAG TPA: indole-3-glycerol-phosphate synthase [Candidatus Sulfotelmatobacter sp.]|nr:indole-3-glycerol-phosphate synthase [Candidatus Sulfotelmatobacter sp.]